MGHADRGGAVPGYTMQKEQLQTRLRRIEGQVRGVARMIDEDKYCVDVVTQVAAIQAALDKVSLGLLDGHIRGCVREEIQAGGGDARVDELLQVMDRVLRRWGAAAGPRTAAPAGRWTSGWPTPPGLRRHGPGCSIPAEPASTAKGVRHARSCAAWPRRRRDRQDAHAR
jgi:CsoR family transcriptional regulator, copper-sensing transcriptional repressor